MTAVLLIQPVAGTSPTQFLVVETAKVYIPETPLNLNA
jgi:hypothetical protein